MSAPRARSSTRSRRPASTAARAVALAAPAPSRGVLRGARRRRGRRLPGVPALSARRGAPGRPGRACGRRAVSRARARGRRRTLDVRRRARLQRATPAPPVRGGHRCARRRVRARGARGAGPGGPARGRPGHAGRAGRGVRLEPGLLRHAAPRLGMSPARYRDGGRGERIAYTSLVTPLGVVVAARSSRGVCFVQLGPDEAGLERLWPASSRRHRWFVTTRGSLTSRRS